jgi:hypothetical protein
MAQMGRDDYITKEHALEQRSSAGEKNEGEVFLDLFVENVDSV